MNIFKIANKKYLHNISHYNSREGKEYVYVLFTSHASPKEVNVPFWIGSIKNSKQLTKLAEVEDYYQVYETPAIVHIVGIVSSQKSEMLLDKLEEKMNSANLPLYYDDFEDLTLPLKKSNDSHVRNVWDGLIKEWQKEVNASFPVAKKTETVSYIDRKQVLSTVLKRKYNTPLAQKFSLSLVNSFNWQTGTSTMLFETSKDEDKHKKILKVIQQLNGDWYLKEKFQLGKPMVFYMSDSLKKAIIANKQY